MDLSVSPEDDAFRQAVRAFIRDQYPREMRVQNAYTDPNERQRPLRHGIRRDPAKARCPLFRG